MTKLRLSITGVNEDQCSAMAGNVVISKTGNRNENVQRMSSDTVITEQKESKHGIIYTQRARERHETVPGSNALAV